MKQNSCQIYVGCYGTKEEETIHIMNFDAETQVLQKIASYKGVENPSYLTVNKQGNMLYAISEVEQGEVISFRILDGSRLQRISSRKTKGSPCYVELSNKEQCLFTANYGNGSSIVHSLGANGEIEKEMAYHPIMLDQHTFSNIHMMTNMPNSNYYIATDIAQDKLYVYIFDGQKEILEFYQEFQLPNDSGPRHLVCHTSKNVFYIVNEYKDAVYVCQYEEAMKKMQLIQVVRTIPTDFRGDNYGADIHLSPSGEYLYVSNRGHHSLTAFQIKEDGTLVQIQCISTAGKWPRNFAVLPDGKYLLAANEHTNEIMIMEIEEDGKLSHTGNRVTLNSPVCICPR